VKFVVASGFYAGLGFALRLQDEGHDVLLAYGRPDDRRRSENYHRVGCGLLPRRPLADVIAERDRYKDWIFIWDENHSVEENELLRSEGFRVFGGGRYADSMEHDRNACLQLVEQHGLHPPPSHPFETPADGLRFLETQGEVAFVYKPDRGETHETWVPESPDAAAAKDELIAHLRSLPDDAGSFILQERKDGIETDVEVWFTRGEPRFAFMTLEAKRKLTGDLGDFSGCALDFTFVVPLDCRAVQESVGRLFPAYRRMCYTGFGDANFVVARDGVWFFEKCERFGYNAHPNLLWTLNRASLGQTFEALVDGSFEPDMSPGFGASCTLYMDHPAAGKVVRFPDSARPHLYLMDVYADRGALLTAGYNELVAIATGFGYTIPTAWDACISTAWQVIFPGRSFRVDGADTNYPASPLRRYEALKAMGYI
jgi:phosphoribosylamine-glycine ligase